MGVRRRIARDAFHGWRPSAIILGLAMTFGSSVTAQSQEVIDCDNIGIELVETFLSPICHKVRFRGGGIGRHESIQGETPDHFIHFQSSRSGAGSTYLYSLDFEQLAEFYGIGDVDTVMSAESEAGDGFDFVTVGGDKLDNCILFLRQTRQIRNGYRAQYYGLACDKNQKGDYTPEQAMALLGMVEEY